MYTNIVKYQSSNHSPHKDKKTTKSLSRVPLFIFPVRCFLEHGQIVSDQGTPDRTCRTGQSMSMRQPMKLIRSPVGFTPESLRGVTDRHKSAHALTRFYFSRPFVYLMYQSLSLLLLFYIILVSVVLLLMFIHGHSSPSFWLLVNNGLYGSFQTQMPQRLKNAQQFDIDRMWDMHIYFCFFKL